MKIRKLLLCLMILLPTYSFSQTTSTITITPEQLKTTNLIFLEHEKYTKEVPLLNKKIEKEDPNGEVTVEKMFVRDNAGAIIGEFVNDNGEWDFLPTSVSS